MSAPPQSAPAVFHATSPGSKARAGVLTTRSGQVSLPTVMLYTRRGGPLSLTPDMMATIGGLQTVQLDAMQFLHNPDPSVIAELGKGAHGFLAVEGYSVMASNRDPTIYEYGARPNSDKEVYVCIHSGGQQVSPERYMGVMAALKPDMYITLSDEITAEARPKRIATSVKRNKAFLDACLELQGKHSLQALPFAAVTGGSTTQGRTDAAKAVADHPVGGYAICGLGTGESPEARPALLRAALDNLPIEHRPVFAPGLASLDDMLDAVAEGVDMFDTPLPLLLSSGGYALHFPLRPPGTGSPTAPPSTSSAVQAAQHHGTAAGHPTASASAAAGADQQQPSSSSKSASSFGSTPPAPIAPEPGCGTDETKINLWSTSYRLDKAPLVPGCGCFACRRHSRAYLHHLLQTHEMLSDVLLEAHNTHHLLGFFQAIREAITEGRFEEYRTWFKGLRSQPLGPLPPPSYDPTTAQAAATLKRRYTPGAADGLADAGAPKGGVSSEGGAAGSDEPARSPPNKWVKAP